MNSFTATPYQLNNHLVLRLPNDISATLTSRSQVMANGTINNQKFTLPFEPDGMGGHWIDVPADIATTASISDGGEVVVTFEQTNDWPEPIMPQEFLDMLAVQPEAKATYDKATPIAHWEWLRWTLATNNPETFKKHIEVSRSKLEKGMRRPCCFNRASCTTADVAKNGILIDPR